ncbi:MAG TPA: DivIVA domain-containing protein [Thermoleophilia bacterium]|nr:DivIVA domain-containing protein [Thermoleophilia bacterium]
MKLTPLDIRHKEFKRGMRGYADVEVDEFLDEVADEYERLFKENIDLQDRVEALEEKVAGYQRIEETLQKTLVNAQASAEEQKQNANKQAQLILQDAEMKARQMANEAYSERQAIEQSMAKLKSGEEDFRFKFRQMLEGYLRQLGEAKKSAEEPAGQDLARHAEAIKEAIARESAPKPPAEPAASPPAVHAAEESKPEPAATPPAVHAAAESEPEPPRRSAQQAPPVAPARGPGGIARGPGGVQAGVQRRDPAPDAAPAEPEVTRIQPAGQPADDAGESEAPPKSPTTSDEADADETPVRRERILFGETDDLLDDVDSGVNENEFKW